MANLKGIDVSKHNGVINWNIAKQSGEVIFFDCVYRVPMGGLRFR